jgi:hypothetical protein
MSGREAKVFPGTGRYDERGAVMIRSPNGSERWYAKAVYTVEDAGALLGWKRSAAHKHAKNGTLPTIDLNGHRHVTAASLDRLVNPRDYTEEPVADESEAEAFEPETYVAPVQPPEAVPADGDDDLADFPLPPRATALDTLMSYDPPKPPAPPNPNPLPTEPWLDGEVLQPEAFPTPATAEDEDDSGGRTLPSGVWVGKPIYY